MPIVPFLAVLFAAHAVSPGSDEPTSPAESEETQTIVQAPRSEAPATESRTTTEIVTGEQLRATGERSLPRALGQAAGVWIQETNLGGGAPFLRGLTGNQVLILVDGVRLNDSTTRFGPNQSLNTIDPSIVERVEVSFGPSSVLYGSDAIGGVVHIYTRRRLTPADGGEKGLESLLGLQLESATEGGRGVVRLSDAFGDDAWLVNGSGAIWNDLRAGDGEEQDFTGYDTGALFGAWEHSLGDGRTLRFSSRYNRDNDVPRTDRLVAGFGQSAPAADVFEFDLQERQSHVLSYTDESPGWAERSQWRLFFNRYQEDLERVNAGSSVLRLESDTVATVGLGADWRKPAGADHLLTFGFDVAHDCVDSSRTDVTAGVPDPKDGNFAPNSTYTSLGLFLQDEVFAFEPYDVTLGLRYSLYDWSADAFPSQSGSVDESGTFDAVTASLAAARDVAENVRLTATLSQGFRAPNLAELAKDGAFGSGLEVHNPDLDPERSLTFELAADVEGERWSGGIAGYYTDIDDVVGRRLVDPGGVGVDPTYLRENQGRVVIQGVELRGRCRLGAEDSPWSAESRLAWQRGRQYDDTVDLGSGTMPFYDVPWRRVPPVHGGATLVWTASEAGAVDRANLGVRFAGEQDELHPDDLTDPRIDPDGTPGWTVFDASLEGALGSGKTTWTAGVYNLLDRNYRVHGSGFDAPGRNLVVGLEWRP